MSQCFAPPPTCLAAVFAFLSRAPKPDVEVQHAHLLRRAAYWATVASHYPSELAVAVLTAAYDIGLSELDGGCAGAFVQQRAAIARLTATRPGEAVLVLARYIAEVEAGVIHGEAPDEHTTVPGWSEWGASHALDVTEAPVRIKRVSPTRIFIEWE